MTDAKLKACLQSAREARERDDAHRMTHDAFQVARRRYMLDQTEANYAAYWQARKVFLETWGASEPVKIDAA